MSGREPQHRSSGVPRASGVPQHATSTSSTPPALAEPPWPRSPALGHRHRRSARSAPAGGAPRVFLAPLRSCSTAPARVRPHQRPLTAPRRSPANGPAPRHRQRTWGRWRQRPPRPGQAAPLFVGGIAGPVSAELAVHGRQGLNTACNPATHAQPAELLGRCSRLWVLQHPTSPGSQCGRRRPFDGRARAPRLEHRHQTHDRLAAAKAARHRLRRSALPRHRGPRRRRPPPPQRKGPSDRVVLSSAWRSAPRSTRTAARRRCRGWRPRRWRSARSTSRPAPGRRCRRTARARRASSSTG